MRLSMRYPSEILSRSQWGGTTFSALIPSHIQTAFCMRKAAKDAAKLSLTQENAEPILWDTGRPPAIPRIGGVSRRRFNQKKESLMKRLLAGIFCALLVR